MLTGQYINSGVLESYETTVAGLYLLYRGRSMHLSYFFSFINKCAFEGLYTLVGCSKILEVLCFIQSMEIYTVECILQSRETNVLYLLRQGALLQVKVNKITSTKTQLSKYTTVNRFLWRLGIGQCFEWCVCAPALRGVAIF